MHDGVVLNRSHKQLQQSGADDLEDLFQSVDETPVAYPDYSFYDTLAASRQHFGHRLPNHQLQTVAAACGYDLRNHHHALADAEACAAIALKLL